MILSLFWVEELFLKVAYLKCMCSLILLWMILPLMVILLRLYYYESLIKKFLEWAVISNLESLLCPVNVFGHIVWIIWHICFFFSLFYLSRNPGLNLFLYIIIIDFMGVLLHSESIEYICIFINGKEDKIITYLITHHQCLYHSWFCLCSQNWKKCRRKLELSND